MTKMNDETRIKDTSNLPKPTKRRLVELLPLLNECESKKITSLALSSLTGWKASLIRHDLWLIGFNKGVKNGYFVKEIINKINELLENKKNAQCEKQETIKNCCIVGLGRLGAALLDESLTKQSMFVIKAGFDSNLNRVEILRSTFPLYPANKMQQVIKNENIEIAILTVEQKDAKQMAERLVSYGIKGIVNMTNQILSVPQNIKVENLSILNALNLVI